MASITTDQLEALSKQVFITDYLLNGLFPCQSDVVRLIRNKKKEWKFNDKFEYRMLLANTNTGGTLNSQVYRENVHLNKPGSLEYGLFQASYGTVTDGFDVDMMVNLETKERVAAFETDYATRMHSMRNNVASLFKNFAIHGRFGVVHQLRSSIDNDMANKYSNNPIGFTSADKNPKCNVMDNSDSGAHLQPGVGANAVPFTIKVPINVFNSNFKAGKLLIKTVCPASSDYPVGISTIEPYGPADPAYVNEMYQVIDNQPGLLTLIAVGTKVTKWMDGEFLEVAQNRDAPVSGSVWSNWVDNVIPNVGNRTFAQLASVAGDPLYSWGAQACTGAMEGLSDLLPWYTGLQNDAAAGSTPNWVWKYSDRFGLNVPFRGQSDRLTYSTEQAGGFIFQEDTEHIIDTIMRGAFLTKATVPYADIGIWINPVTRIQMGYEEGAGVQVLRDNFVAGPIVYQRGIKTTDYQIGNQVVKEVVEDLNMPTDVIIIGPKNDMSYNCWDNATMEIDKYIQDTWSKSEPPKIQELQLPSDLIASLDISKRITFGSPTVMDGALFQGNGSYLRHPKNVIPVAMHEMGALYTEHPYAYTIVKLRKPIADIITT